MQYNFKKPLDLKNLGLPYWAQINFMIYWSIGVRLEKYSDYFTGFGLILWFIGLVLEKCLDQLMHSDFIITNQGCCWKILKTYLNNLLGCSPKYEKQHAI